VQRMQLLERYSMPLSPSRSIRLLGASALAAALGISGAATSASALTEQEAQDIAV
jgi:hypothetical protein